MGGHPVYIYITYATLHDGARDVVGDSRDRSRDVADDFVRDDLRRRARCRTAWLFVFSVAIM